jgi:uncharacterized DUF497 family protein
MSRLTFEWDPRKDSANQKKHRISFNEAASVFYDENARLIHDPDHSITEDRFILLGLSLRLNLLIVCHCCGKSSAVIRIISARKASKNEQEQYNRWLP